MVETDSFVFDKKGKIKNGDRFPYFVGQYTVCGVNVHFSVRAQIAIGKNTPIAVKTYRYRGVISLRDPCGDGKVLRYFGSYAQSYLQSYCEKNHKTDLTDSAKDCILRVSKSLYSNAQTEEVLLQEIQEQCRELLAGHGQMVCDRIKMHVTPYAVTPSQAALLYISSFLTHRHHGAKRKAIAGIQNTIMAYFPQLTQKPMVEFSRKEMAKFVRQHNISDYARDILYHFWAYCIDKHYCVGENPFQRVERKKPTPDGLIRKIEVRQYLTAEERDWLFSLLIKYPDAYACAFALGLWCGLPEAAAMELTWDKIQFRSKSDAIMLLRDTDLGEEFCCATHDLSFALTQQAAEILWTRRKNLREQTGEDFSHRRIVEAAEPITKAKLANYIDSVLARMKAASVAPSELPLGGGYAMLLNTYRLMIDNECGISDDEGTRRFLQHRPLSDLVTDDHYVAYIGEEAWARQRTILRRIAPQAKCRQTEKALDDTHTQYSPQYRSNRLNLNMEVTLQPGETMAFRAVHGLESSFSVVKMKKF